MTKQYRKEAIEHIEAQLKGGCVDLGFHDQDEIEIIKEAIDVLKMVDKLNDSGCTSFTIIPTQEKPIKVKFEGKPEIKVIDCDNPLKGYYNPPFELDEKSEKIICKKII